MTTRRKFLASCSTFTLAATVAPGRVLAAPTASKLSPDQLSLATFAQHVQTTFEVRPQAARRVALKLVQVQPHHSSHPLAAKAPDAANEKFSLLFRGPRGKPLTQDTYQFDHEKMGRFLMFIVPVFAKGGHKETLYEAVFNRPANSGQAS